MTVMTNEMRAVLYPLAPDGDLRAFSSRVDSPDDVAGFVEQAVQLAEQTPAAGLSIEFELELDTEPRVSRLDLDEFRFRSCAGVGLDPAKAGWYRQHLRLGRAHLDERPAGELVLFTGQVLDSMPASDDRDWTADPISGELFVPWHSGTGDEFEQQWLSTGAGVAQALAPGGFDRFAEKLAVIRQAVGDLGFIQIPVDVEPARYVVPFLAYPDQTMMELGRPRYDGLPALLHQATGAPPDDLDPGVRQELELRCLAAATFKGGPDERLMIRWDADEFRIYGTDNAAVTAVVGALGG